MGPKREPDTKTSWSTVGRKINITQLKMALDWVPLMWNATRSVWTRAPPLFSVPLSLPLLRGTRLLWRRSFLFQVASAYQAAQSSDFSFPEPDQIRSQPQYSDFSPNKIYTFAWSDLMVPFSSFQEYDHNTLTNLSLEESSALNP
jgi:hypothetical protein